MLAACNSALAVGSRDIECLTRVGPALGIALLTVGANILGVIVGRAAVGLIAGGLLINFRRHRLTNRLNPPWDCPCSVLQLPTSVFGLMLNRDGANLVTPGSWRASD